MITKPGTPEPGTVLRKLALYVGLGLFSLYLLIVVAGYSWFHYVRKNDQVRLKDVALFQLGSIRRGIAVQHFANAQKEWDAQRYQAAYLFFSAGVRQDPENIEGRLATVKFLRSVGAGKQALIMLEDGLKLNPEDRRLIQATFDFLLATGRDHHAIDLLKLRYGSGYAGKNEALLQGYEVQATLTAFGALAAKQLLDRYANLRQDAQSAPVVARVLWESSEHLRAIGLLEDYVRSQHAVFSDFALLAGWQQAEGKRTEAVRTARAACDKFPQELPPRILLIDKIMAESPSGAAGQEAIAAYLRDFSNRPESIGLLAVLAGEKGLVEMTRLLYLEGANRQLDLNLLALSYSDSLMRVSRFEESRKVLNQLETQAPENNTAYMIQLRQRQVILAAALGDSDNVREYTRRLATALGTDQDGLDICRRLFLKLGIKEAVAELSERAPSAPATAAAARKQI